MNNNLSILIYSRQAVLAYSGSRFQRWKKFSTFRGALCYLVSKTKMQDGDNSSGTRVRCQLSESYSTLSEMLDLELELDADQKGLNSHFAYPQASTSTPTSPPTLTSPSKSQPLPKSINYSFPPSPTRSLANMQIRASSRQQQYSRKLFIQ
jgi:hypothetical protein